MADITFLDAGSAATQGFEFWPTTLTGGSDTWSSDSSVARNNTRSIKLASAGGSDSEQITGTGVMADAGSRASVYHRTTHLPSSGTAQIVRVTGSSIATTIYAVGFNTSGNIVLIENNTVRKTSSGTFSTNTWVRISAAHVITTTTNFTIKVWAQVDGSETITLLFTATNADFTLTNTGASRFALMGIATSRSSASLYWSDIYIDNGTGLDDTGNIHVTPKLPASDNTEGFDTGIGSSPADRYTNVDDRPIDTGSGWQQAASSQATEDYTLETAAVGDADVSSATIVGYGGWVYAKREGAAHVGFIGEGQNKAAGTSLTITITNSTVATGDTIFITFACDPGTSAQTGSATGATVSWSVEEDVTNAGDTQHVLLRGDVTSGGTLTALSVSWTGSVTAKCATADRYSGVGTRSTTGGGQNSDTDPNTISAVDNKTVPACGLAVGGSAVESETAGTLDAVTSGTPALTITSSPGGVISTTGGGDSSNQANRQGYSENPYGVDSTSYIMAFDCGTDSAASGGVYNPLGGAGTEKIRLNGSDYVLALGTIASAHFAFVTSASYPSNAAGIGIKSTGNAADTYLYECGVQIAYFPATGGGRTTKNTRAWPLGTEIGMNWRQECAAA